MHKDTQTDVLIIGGGVIGLACAYYLTQAGRQVHLIEKDTLGAGASHGNCGLLFLAISCPCANQEQWPKSWGRC